VKDPGISKPGGDLVSRLYASHSRALLGYFARRVYDAETARDLVAETFAQALLAQRRYRGKSDAEAESWIYTIARRQLSRYIRKGQAEKRAVRKLGMDLPPLTDEDVVRIEELADTEGLRVTIAQALQQLGQDHRDAVELRVVKELPYPEVAARLGVSEQTARARVSRALRRLAEILDEPLDAGEVKP
jgi:RNA polymerase sigma factor (sigma-70 family)